jgi:energy-coupling factor transporter transmembrane protein EcfT
MTGRRRPTELNLLRPIPGKTPIHQLWAGTKLIALGTVVTALSYNPSWLALAVGGAFVLACLLLARIPAGAAPRLPRWFWILLVVGALISLRSTRTPLAHVGPATLSLGALDDWTRLTVLAIVLLAAAALVSWTTPLSEVAPALATIGTPLRWVRLPVDEWATAAALSIRCLPLLVDEVRTLTAARRLRQRDRRPGQSRISYWSGESQDLLMAALTVSMRRAAELGEAIEARGGFGRVSDVRRRAGWRDLGAMIVVAGVVAGILVI